MMRLIYLDPALTDIEGILDFISNDNPAAALRFGYSDKLSIEGGVPVAILTTTPRAFHGPSHSNKTSKKRGERLVVYCIIYCIREKQNKRFN